MPLDPTPIMVQTVEVTLKASRSGEERRNVIHYLYTGPAPSAAELATLCAEVRDRVVDRYEDFTSIGTIWYEVHARDCADPGGAQYSLGMTRLSAGPVSVMPGQVSCCITKRTNSGGRSFRGRFYTIDNPEEMWNGDDMNPLYIPVIADFGTRLLEPRVSARFVPSVGSRKLGGSTQMTAITFDLVVDTQRRRTKGRGI